MGKKLQRAPLIAALTALILAVAISACGGSSSSSESSTSPAAGGNAPPAGEKGTLSSPGEKSEKKGEQGSSSFIKPNGPNNKYAKFGQEASSAELTAASEVLAENLEAREAADFATQCETLSTQANEEIVEVKDPSEARSRCPQKLKELATPLKGTEEFRVNTFGGDLAALRVKGHTGYAFYHGTDKKDWMVPMVKEGSAWKVSSIQTTEV